MQKLEGIIFRSFKYSETSIIVDIYTMQEGVLSFIISGVRKKNASTSAAMLQVMNIVDVVVIPSKTNKLGRITEIKNHYIHQNLLFDFVRSSIGIFIIELSRNCIREQESNPQIYDFIKTQLIYIDAHHHVYGVYPLYYLIAFSSYLGFKPQNNYSEDNRLFNWKNGKFVPSSKEDQFTLNEISSRYLHTLLPITIADLDKVEIPKSERQLLIKIMLLYYQYHIESFKPLKSYEVLEEMMK